METLTRRNQQAILEEELLRGEKRSNHLRFVFSGLILLSVLGNGINSLTVYQWKGLAINLTAVLFYAGITFFHSRVLKKGAPRRIKVFSHITLLADFAIVIFVLISWYSLMESQNPAFFLKNSVLFYFFLPLALTALRFNPRQVYLCLLLFLVIYYGFVLYGLLQGMPLTNDWEVYLFGKGVALSDILTTKPLVYTAMALALAYGIRRSRVMLNKMGKAVEETSALSRFFSPAVVQEITEHPSMIQGGQNRRALVMFCDIRGFTTLSEQMSPGDLSVFLSRYRREMTEIIFRHEGLLDKYIGDGLMALFGIPERPGGAEEVCRSGLQAAEEMLQAAADMNRFDALKLILPPGSSLKIGIGLHYGELFAGTLGFKDRLEFTAIGDAVNTASRLEGLSKEMGFPLIVSEQVYRLAGSPSEGEPLPPTPIKGKKKKLNLYGFY